MSNGLAQTGKLFFFLFVVGFAASCTQGNSNFSKRPPNEPGSLQAGEFLRDAAIFSKKDSAPALDVTRYDLKANFDWSRNRLVAEVAINFRLDAAEKTLVLDSSVAEVHSVKLPDGTALPFTQTSSLLQVDLSSIPKRQNEIQILVSYESDANVLPSGESSAITSVPARAGDPVKSRVVYSTSEPLGAQIWMPCHNTPSDRAFFSAEFTMPSGETLISNGDLKINEVNNDVRRMRYETRYSLPSYLMAFAVGEFSSATAYHNGLPVSMWARKGLNANYQGMLNAIIQSIAHYESLLIPYPFEKYAIVLLPEFPAGGVEHAGITFQAENRSTQSALSSDTGLMEHELGHQWFGDFMTVETWDDLWIKEGMATLLAEEASRSIEDENKSGRLFGRNFGVGEGDAIRDPNLAPDNKYTSGPYGRSAWLLTQIRSLVGETNFWGTLRNVLNAHAFGNIGTDALVAAFEPLLGSAMSAKIHTALAAKAMPTLKVAQSAAGWTLSLEDTDHAMIAPLEISWLSPDNRRNETLAPGGSLLLKPQSGEMLAIDPRDVHALASFHTDLSELLPSVLQLAVPKTAVQNQIFFQASANIQLFALGASDPWDLNPENVATFLKSFASEEARYDALQTVCDVAKRKSATTGAAIWEAPITQALLRPVFAGLPSTPTGKALSVCGTLAEDGLFLNQWRSLAADPSGDEFTEPQQQYLTFFNGPTDEAFQTWSALADGGASVRSRLIGIAALSRHLAGNGFSVPSQNEIPAWKAFYRHVFQDSDVSELQAVALNGIVRMQDKDALPAFTTVVKNTRRPDLQTNVVCAAYRMVGQDAVTWTGFIKGFGLTSGLNPHLASLLSQPEQSCGGH